MLFISIGVWVTAVYALRTAFWGNPLLNCLRTADAEMLYRAEQVAVENRLPASEQELEFMRRISRISITEMVVLVLEIGLLFFFVSTGRVFWLSAALLAKNLAMVGLSIEFSRRSAASGDGVFAAISRLPAWVLHLDRASSSVSAIGFILLFLSLNGVLRL